MSFKNRNIKLTSRFLLPDITNLEGLKTFDIVMWLTIWGVCVCSLQERLKFDVVRTKTNTDHNALNSALGLLRKVSSPILNFLSPANMEYELERRPRY